MLELQDQVSEQQALFLHRVMPVLVCSTCLAGVFAAYIVWSAIGALFVSCWLGVVVAATLLRLYRWRIVTPAGLVGQAARTWIGEMQLGAAVSGTLWGTLAVVVLREADLGLRVAMLLGGVFLSVASCFSYGARLSVFLLFFLPATLPAVPCLYLHGDRVDRGLSGGLVLFVIVMTVSAWRFNDLFVQHLLLGLRNAALVGQLRQERDAADEASRAKSRALATTSHDLRQPAHAIGLSISSLRMTSARLTTGPPELRSLAAHLQEAVDGLWRLLDTLADISRLDARLVAVSRGVLSLDDELRRAVAIMQPAAAERGLALRLVGTSILVDADPKILSTVLLNLLANAVRYTKSGRILVGCKRRGAKVQVLVCDTGIGFAPAETEAVFSEFTRGRYVEGVAGEGLGLGLAIVRQSLRLLGEDVRIVATSERGSIVGFTLPVVGASQQSQHSSQQSQHSSQQSQHWPVPPHDLAADDGDGNQASA